jgi:hypothetical protein
MHLVDCDQCRAAINGGPVRFGQKTLLCDTYMHLQKMWADIEGRTGQIVHWTEKGAEAPTGRPLE